MKDFRGVFILVVFVVLSSIAIGLSLVFSPAFAIEQRSTPQLSNLDAYLEATAYAARYQATATVISATVTEKKLAQKRPAKPDPDGIGLLSVFLGGLVTGVAVVLFTIWFTARFEVDERNETNEQ